MGVGSFLCEANVRSWRINTGDELTPKRRMDSEQVRRGRCAKGTTHTKTPQYSFEIAMLKGLEIQRK